MRCRGARGRDRGTPAPALPVAPRSGGHCFAGRLDDDRGRDRRRAARRRSRCPTASPRSAPARGSATVYDALLEHGVTIPAGLRPGGRDRRAHARRRARDHGPPPRADLGLARGRDGRARRAARRSATSSASRTCSGRCGARAAAASGSSPRSRSAPCRRRRRPPSTCASRDAAALVEAWQAWAPDAPDELAASLRDHRRPGPGRAAGRQGLRGDARLAGRDRGAAQPLRPRRAPSCSTARTARSSGTWPAPAGRTRGIPYNRSEFFRELLPREAIDELIAAPRGRPAARRDARARLLAVGRRLQPRRRSTRPRSPTATRASCSSTPPCSSRG